MLDKLVRLIRPEAGGGEPASTGSPEQALRVATAALLVEMSRADFNDDAAERAAAERLLAEHFELDGTEARELLGLGGRHADEAVSLHEFTRLLHDELSPAEKRKIVEMLWRVALADSRVDKHEAHLVRKVAGLLYVPNTEAMRLRQVVAAELEKHRDKKKGPPRKADP